MQVNIVRTIVQTVLWAQPEQLVAVMQLEDACCVIKSSLWQSQANIEWKDPHPFFVLPQNASSIHDKLKISGAEIKHKQATSKDHRKVAKRVLMS